MHRPHTPFDEATPAGGPVVITVNGGSSSVKFSMATVAQPASPVLSGVLDRIGGAGGSLRVREGRGEWGQPEPVAVGAFKDATRLIVDVLKSRLGAREVLGIGHRIVHGGVKSHDHQLVTPELMDALDGARVLDPAHLPREIELIEGFGRAFPGASQVACFDTAFHRELPRAAQLLAIPRRFFRAGVRRVGFHGLSYTSLMGQLATLAGPEAARGRVILAHLGSGASMSAVRGGRPIDTTMAFTPTSGLVMATRPGDLDPGVVVHVMRAEGLSVQQLDDLLSRECGLLGVSETSGDVRDLLALRDTDPRAAEAIELFCAQARKHLCALAGALGGVDTIVFAGGIGEHSAEVRAGICQGLEFLGVRLDEARNSAGNAVISGDDSKVTVRVMQTDEESVMVGIVARLMGAVPTRAGS
ncbi:MAG: acetate/propionate family kinase [Planctomycetota bacterium]